LKPQGGEYKGHKIEIRKVGDKKELFINNSRIKYGQLPKGLYFLDKYAYDWKENLIDLSKAFIDYRAKVEEIHRKQKSARGSK
jgi:hypothetical protein